MVTGLVTGVATSRTVDLVKLSSTSRLRNPRRQTVLSALVSMPFELVDGKAPTEFCIFKAGDNPSEKGTFVFDVLSQELVMAKYAERGVPMLMDYEHQSMVDPPIEAPASAKSFVPEVRNGDLWATQIVWTDRGRAYLESGEYRLFSPAFGFDELDDGRMRVTKLINVALTNNPALHNIEPLMAAKDKDDDMDEEMKQLKAQVAALQAQLSALTTENASLSTANASLSAQLKGKPFGDEEETKATAALRDEVKTITGKTDLKEATGVLRSIALKAKGADEAVTTLKEIQANGRETEFVALLDAAWKEGKISPAQRKEFWEKQCRGEDKRATVEGLAMLKDFIKTAPVQVNIRETAGVASRGGVMRTSDEKAIMTRFGMTDAAEIKRFDEFRAIQES